MILLVKEMKTTVQWWNLDFHSSNKEKGKRSNFIVHKSELRTFVHFLYSYLCLSVFEYQSTCVCLSKYFYLCIYLYLSTVYLYLLKWTKYIYTYPYIFTYLDFHLPSLVYYEATNALDWYKPVLHSNLYDNPSVAPYIQF